MHEVNPAAGVMQIEKVINAQQRDVQEDEWRAAVKFGGSSTQPGKHGACNTHTHTVQYNAVAGL
jgi:hypothetical protein